MKQIKRWRQDRKERVASKSSAPRSPVELAPLLDHHDAADRQRPEERPEGLPCPKVKRKSSNVSIDNKKLIYRRKRSASAVVQGKQIGAWESKFSSRPQTLSEPNIESNTGKRRSWKDRMLFKLKTFTKASTSLGTSLTSGREEQEQDADELDTLLNDRLEE